MKVAHASALPSFLTLILISMMMVALAPSSRERPVICEVEAEANPAGRVEQRSTSAFLLEKEGGGSTRLRTPLRNASSGDVLFLRFPEADPVDANGWEIVHEESGVRHMLNGVENGLASVPEGEWKIVMNDPGKIPLVRAFVAERGMPHVVWIAMRI